MATKGKSKDKKSNTASVGFEEKLWAAADKMRNNMDPAVLEERIRKNLAGIGFQVK